MITLSLSAILLLLLTGCDSNYQNTPTSSSQNSDNATTQTSQTSQNSSSSTTSTQSYNKATTFQSHEQGSNCLECHNPSYYSTFGAKNLRFENEAENENENESESERSDDAETFTSGATLYGTLHGDNSALTQGYSLRLVLESTNEIVKYDTGRGTSNFSMDYIYSINNYTAQVLDANGNIINSSQTNSHDNTRLDCNRCHTQNGTNGAPGRISVNGVQNVTTTTSSSSSSSTSSGSSSSQSTQSNAVSFSSDVMPILTTKCKACHGNNGRFSVSSTDGTYNNLTANGFIDTNTPDDARLLQKARNRFFLHGGGEVLSQNSSGYKTIAQWMLEGAQNN